MPFLHTHMGRLPVELNSGEGTFVAGLISRDGCQLQSFGGVEIHVMLHIPW